MERDLNEEENDSSFELFEPIIPKDGQTLPLVNTSLPDSMSIVAIPEELKTPVFDINSRQLNDMSNALQLSQTISGFNSSFGVEFETRKLEPMDDSLPTYQQIAVQDLNSIKTLSQSLHRMENNANKCFNDLVTNDLEIYFKEIRDENEKLRNELEKNNLFMKQQLKNLHEWQTKSKESADEHKRVSDLANQLSEENTHLKEENTKLKNKVLDLEGFAGMKLVEELSTEVATLRSKCDQLSTYGKLNVSSELKSQELCSLLTESQLKIDGMNNEINALRRQLTEANGKLEYLSAMESQLYVFERDFKLEEMAKLAALKEVNEFESEIEKLKAINAELEEKVEKGQPVVELKAEQSVGKHHRKHHSRHTGKLGRHTIPALSVGAVLKGFKQYNTTSNNA